MGTFAGAGIALGLTWVDSFLVANGTPPEGTYLDEILAGMLAAGLVLVLDFYYADKLRRLREAAKLVRQLNHYIRNSLQVILYSNTTQPDPVAREALTKAVRRIEWVLDELVDENELFCEARVYLAQSHAEVELASQLSKPSKQA